MLGTTTTSGHLIDTPQIRQTRDGEIVTTLRVAINDHRLGDQPRYIDIDQWDDAAHRAADHPIEGRQITAEGLLEAEPYLHTDGQLRVGWRLLRPTGGMGSRPPSARPLLDLADELQRRDATATA
jgi:single-stranded DNA-binding protein